MIKNLVIGGLIIFGLSITSRAQDLSSAHTDWILSCQGCHKPDATGIEGQVPNMSGFVGRFLEVEGGREYLSRVPGVAYAGLDDKEVADLLNWMIKEFDAEHFPSDFKKYTAEEVGKLRKRPFINDAPKEREKLVQKMK